MTILPETTHKLKLLRQFFARTDTFAIFAPWGKPCRAEPLGPLDEVLLGHLGIVPKVALTAKKRLAGDEQLQGQFRVGTYCFSPDQTVSWLCYDFDGQGHAAALADPLDAALQCLRTLSKAGLTGYLEKSGGGAGWHVWMFFEEPFPAAKARDLAQLFVPKDVRLESGEPADARAGHGIEVFPKQDSISTGGFGSQVWLPWWVGAPEGANEFYREDGSAELQKYVPVSFESVSVEVVKTLLGEIPINGKDKNVSDSWKSWRAEALAKLPLEKVYGELFTGKKNAGGWLECRDPDSPSGDQNPSAGVADGTGDAARGTFHSFRTGVTLSVFDFLIKRGRAKDLSEACRLVADLSGVSVPTRTKDASRGEEVEGSLDDTCAGLLCSDIGNGKRLALRYGRHLRYCHPWKKWLVYDGKRWRLDDSGAAIAYAKRAALDIYREVSVARDPVQLSLLQKHAPKSCSASAVEAMLRMAASEPGITVQPDALDQDPWSLNVENGTIDLRTGRLRPHSPADLLTRLAPVSFDPEAECPTWLRFLDRIMAGDASLIGFLQRAVGYTLAGDVGADGFFFGHGGGANGKGVFLNTLTKLLGDYAAVLPAEVLLEARSERHPTDKTMLHGVRMAVCQEIKEGRRFDMATVKSLTGRDPITARRMREDFWTFLPTHKLWIAANNQPGVSENDEASWRRIMLVPFEVTIPEAERDPTLSARCAAEGPGILAWAVRGLLEWRAAGEGKQGLQAPARICEATAAYRQQEDILGAFIEDRCVRVPCAKCGKGELYIAFQRWCETTHEPAMPKRSFITRIERLDGVAAAKVSRERGWRGIGIRGAPIQQDMHDGARV